MEELLRTCVPNGGELRLELSEAYTVILLKLTKKLIALLPKMKYVVYGVILFELCLQHRHIKGGQETFSKT